MVVAALASPLLRVKVINRAAQQHGNDEVSNNLTPHFNDSNFESVGERYESMGESVIDQQ